MKIIYFFILLIGLLVKIPLAWAQVPASSKEGLIFFAVDKKKGIYRNFDEFRNNSPSIPYKGKVIDSGLPDMVHIDFYEGHDAPCPKNTDIWGFCDGLTVFISETGKFKKKNVYTRLQYIGRYSYFQKEVFIANSNQMGYSYATRTYAYGIDANTGEVFRLNEEVVLYILYRDEALMKKFEKTRKKQEDLGVYLRLYSTNHPEEIK